MRTRRGKLAAGACLLLFFCLLPILSCSGNRGGWVTVEASVPGYRTATFDRYQDGGLTLYAERGVCESEEELDSLFDRVRGDMAQVAGAFSIAPDVVCYVIADPAAAEGEAVFENGILLGTRAAMEGGSGRRALVGACLRTTEPWKQYGACATVFGGAGKDEEELRAYYADGNDPTLTLFPAYFLRAFCADSDMAVKTACSFGPFVLLKFGLDAFLAADATAYRTEYLHHLGVARPFSVGWDLSFLSGAAYRLSASSAYPLVIETANRTYSLSPIAAARATARLATPEDVLACLAEGNAACGRMLAYLCEHAPESYEFVQARYAGHLYYYISDHEVRTRCDVDRRSIYLRDPSEWAHETAHAITLAENPAEGAFLGEGVAEFLSRRVSGQISDIHHRFFLAFTDPALPGEMAEFVSAVRARYEERGGSFATFADFDFALLLRTIGETTQKNPAYREGIPFPLATTPICHTYLCPAGGGNDLTYPEAYALTEYLIVTYGPDRVLACCARYEPAAVFGAEITALLADWRASLA